jgi:hypothetical protein
VVTISPALERVIRKVGEPTSPAYQNLRAVFEESPVLMQQMNDAVAQGHLENFALMPPSENAGASYDPQTRTVNLKRGNLVDQDGRDALTFLIGHEIQHGINRQQTRQGLEEFDNNVRRVLESGQPIHDYSAAFERMLEINRRDEASAHIAGWNALVSRARHINPAANLADLGNLARDVGYLNDFIERKEVAGRMQFAAKDGFTINADLSITPNSRNVDAAAKHYFDKEPENTWLGHHGNSDYANYYAAALVSSVCQYEMLNPSLSGDVQLDMHGLGLQEKLLEQNGISLGTASARCAYFDTRTPSVAAHFDHTLDSHEHTPIYGLPAPSQLSQGLNQRSAAVQLDHPAHSDHKLFGQAQAGVHLLDAKVGRTPDQKSDQLAAALAVAARTNGINRIDHVVLSTDASKVFAVEGALDSALKRIASVPTVEALNTPVAQSTQTWEQVSELSRQRVQDQALDHPQTMQRQAMATRL